MSYKTYNKYKESHIDWIGLIPKEWNLTRLKFLADIVTGSTPSKNDDKYYKEGKFPWVKPDDLKGLTPILYTNVLINDEGKRVSRIVPKDSILVCCIGSLGKLGVAGTELATNQQINSLIPNKLLNNNFCKYMISASSSEYDKYANSNVVAIINKQQQGELNYPVPPLDEQKQIANYLDQKTAKIDATIAKNEELIQLLEEKRVALINQVVTKGLNPDVPMKDSGVEWIGEIPEHWDIAPLKRFVKLHNGKEITIEVEEEDENAIGVYGSGGLFKYTNEYLFKGESVLFGRKGTLGKPIYLNDIFWTVDTMYYLSFTPYIYPKYCYYYLILYPWDKISTETAKPSVVGSDVTNSMFAIPNIEEQKQLADYLDDEINKIDETISKIQENSTLLEEYKTSLIHHVVTGKIDVREEVI